MECLWPDVRESDLRALDERAAQQAMQLSALGENVTYLGSLLMREDEVVLCIFEGTRGGPPSGDPADIPYERILETAQSPWKEKPDKGEGMR